MFQDGTYNLSSILYAIEVNKFSSRYWNFSIPYLPQLNYWPRFSLNLETNLLLFSIHSKANLLFLINLIVNILFTRHYRLIQLERHLTNFARHYFLDFLINYPPHNSTLKFCRCSLTTNQLSALVE